MSEKKFVFAADRHGREDDAEGDIYISAGDEIYTLNNDESAEGKPLEDYEDGVFGNAEEVSEIEEYAVGELHERFSQLDKEYEHSYITLGNHEDEQLNKELVKQIAGEYENVDIIEEDLIEIEGRNFYFNGSFEHNRQDGAAQLYDQDEIPAEELDYEQDELESVGEALEKDAEEVTCSDIDYILEEGVEENETSNEDSGLRDTLENLPLVGDRVFQPIYNLKDKYFSSEESTTVTELDLERSQQHQQINEDIGEYEEMLDQKAEKIDNADGKVTFVAHGSPQTEEMPYASIQTRELLERTENIGSAYVGHFHGGFEGEQETEIGGVNVINPMEGYTIDSSGGALEEYETYQFEEDPIAQADPMEMEQPGDDLSEEERQKARQIFEEAQEEAENDQEVMQLANQRLQEAGISI